jgi:S-adenosyl-L-methionine hydrolase (adenosine-forming)
MNVVTLLTDFGLDDNFAGVVKGVILCRNQKAQIVDISHNVPPYDIMQGAFLLRGSFSYFPPGTVHVAVVDPGVGSQRAILAVKTKRYYFLGADNGVLAPALDAEKPLSMVRVENKKFFLHPISRTFHGRDIFAPVAAFLSKGGNMAQLGPRVKNFRRLRLPRARRSGKRILGEIVSIDRFGNCITNITPADIAGCARSLRAKVKNTTIKGLSGSYASVKEGQALMAVNSFGYLEIAVNGASARERFSLNKKNSIEVILR